MSLLGRPMNESLIIDNSPTSYTFHPENAIPILSWYDDPKDRCLFELIPLLESLAEVDDVRKYIPQFVTSDHRVDFQRASHVLANAQPSPSAIAIINANDSKNKRAAAMSMHRVSEHREEDEEDEENDGSAQKETGEGGKRGRSATGKGKNGQPLLFNNQWTLDDEEKGGQQDDKKVRY